MYLSKTNGFSTVDYVLTSEELLKDIIYFHVHEFKPLFSHCHSKVSFSVKASCKPRAFTKNDEEMPSQFKWTQYSPEKLNRALNNPEIKSHINSFLSTQFDINDHGIDSACSKFEEIVIRRTIVY